MVAENEHERENKSALHLSEKDILEYIVRRIPSNITPNDLTIIGFAGAVIAFVAFLLCNISDVFLPIAGFGVFLNWFGDSTDGTLARHRGIERPKLGYMIDHSFDLISNALMFIGLGLSPYFTFFASLLAMSMYYLFSAYTYLKVVAMAQHTLSYGGMGATELRVLMVIWTIVAFEFGPSMFDADFYGYRMLDAVICGLWFLCLISLFYIILKQLKVIWHD